MNTSMWKPQFISIIIYSTHSFYHLYSKYYYPVLGTILTVSIDIIATLFLKLLYLDLVREDHQLPHWTNPHVLSFPVQLFFLCPFASSKCIFVSPPRCSDKIPCQAETIEDLILRHVSLINVSFQCIWNHRELQAHSFRFHLSSLQLICAIFFIEL